MTRHGRRHWIAAGVIAALALVLWWGGVLR
jgi:hypothetical protein